MFTKPTISRLMISVVGLAAAALLTPSAPGEVHVRFGHGGHHGHHSYHKYRSHHGHYSHHRYRGYYGRRYAPYRHHAYRYVRSRYYRRGYASPYVYRRSSPRIVVEGRAARDTADYPTTRAGSSGGQQHTTASPLRRGWRLFEDGHYSRAFDAFAAAATSRPKDGEPKLGYALSAALRGDDSRAAYAMRRVLKFEPGALDQPAPVRGQIIQKLIDRYEYRDSADSRLMLRAMKRLQRAQEESRQPTQPSQDPYPDDHSPDKEDS